MDNTVKFTPTPQWMEEKYNELNAKLFNGKLGGCDFGVFKTGKGASGRTLGYFKITGKNIKYDRRTRKMFVASMYLDKIDEYINADNFVELCKPTIQLNGNYKRTERAWLTTLAHEMCHYYTYMNGKVPSTSHGREFKQIAAIISYKSNDIFSIQRLASSEEMNESELDSEVKAKMEKRDENKKSKLFALLIFRKNGEVQLVTTSSNNVLNDVKNSNTKFICKKILLSTDPNFIDYLWKNHYKHNMRTYRYWTITNTPIVKDIENFKYKVMVDYTNEINESIQLIPEDIQNMVENAIKELINKKNNWGEITSDMILSDKSPLEI